MPDFTIKRKKEANYYLNHTISDIYVMLII